MWMVLNALQLRFKDGTASKATQYFLDFTRDHRFVEYFRPQSTSGVASGRRHNFYRKCAQDFRSFLALQHKQLQRGSILRTEKKVNIVRIKPAQTDPRKVCSSLIQAGPAQILNTSAQFITLHCAC